MFCGGRSKPLDKCVQCCLCVSSKPKDRPFLRTTFAWTNIFAVANEHRKREGRLKVSKEGSTLPAVETDRTLAVGASAGGGPGLPEQAHGTSGTE